LFVYHQVVYVNDFYFWWFILRGCVSGVFWTTYLH